MEDEHGVEHDVQDTADRQTDARLLGFADGTDEMPETKTGNRGNTADYKYPHEVIRGIAQRLGIGTEEGQYRLHENAEQHRKDCRDSDTSPEAEGGCFLRCLLVILTETPGNHAVGTDTEQIRNGSQKRVDRKRDRKCGNLIRITDSSDKERIRKAVKNHNDLADNGRHSELCDCPSNGHCGE